MDLEELVREAQQGYAGQAAFADICRRFAGLVKKYATQPHLAGLKEEAIAEGWLAVVSAVQTYDSQSGVRFAGYVESRVKFAIWNLFKRERRRWQQELPLIGTDADQENQQGLHFLDILAAKDNVEALAGDNFVNDAINKAVANLPDKQRLAVTKTLLQDAHLADVAHELGVTPQAVYGLRQRALNRLRKELANLL